VAPVAGVPASGGNAALMKDQRLLGNEMKQRGMELAGEGKTPLYFAAGGKMLGIIAVADVAKKDSADAVQKLNALGVQVVMLTRRQQTYGGSHREAGRHYTCRIGSAPGRQGRRRREAFGVRESDDGGRWHKRRTCPYARRHRSCDRRGN